MQDRISLTTTVLAAVIFLYSATFPGSLAIKALFAAVLLFAGFILHITVLGGLRRDEFIDQREGKQILMGFIASFIVIVFFNSVFNQCYTGQTTSFEIRMLAILLAVSEEQFFRGFITPYLAQKMGVWLGSVMSGFVFTIYHFAVYGSNIDALSVVFLAGTCLSLVVLWSRRVSPAILAHIVNNLLAAG